MKHALMDFMANGNTLNADAVGNRNKNSSSYGYNENINGKTN